MRTQRLQCQSKTISAQPLSRVLRRLGPRTQSPTISHFVPISTTEKKNTKLNLLCIFLGLDSRRQVFLLPWRELQEVCLDAGVDLGAESARYSSRVEPEADALGRWWCSPFLWLVCQPSSCLTRHSPQSWRPPESWCSGCRETKKRSSQCLLINAIWI